MTRSMLACSLLLLVPGCAPDPGLEFNDADDTGGDTGDPAGPSGVRCELDPAPAYETASMRIAPDGALWLLGVDGVLVRYDRADSETCRLAGEAVAGTESLEAIQDVELDEQGRPYVLVFYDEVRRLDATGAVTWSCPVPGSHALLPVPDGSAVYTWPIGSEALHHATATESCVATHSALPLARAIGTVGAWAGGALAADSFDPSGELPPGSLFDLGTGDLLGDLGVTDPDDEGPVSFADLVPTTDGYVGAESPDGHHWWLDADGLALRSASAEALLLPPNSDDTLNITSIAWQPEGPTYVAAGFLDERGVWELDL